MVYFKVDILVKLMVKELSSMGTILFSKYAGVFHVVFSKRLTFSCLNNQIDNKIQIILKSTFFYSNKVKYTKKLFHFWNEMELWYHMEVIDSMPLYEAMSN